MGLNSVMVRVSNPADRPRGVEAEMLVDPGAIFSVVPAHELARLGVEPEKVERFSATLRHRIRAGWGVVQRDDACDRPSPRRHHQASTDAPRREREARSTRGRDGPTAVPRQSAHLRGTGIPTVTMPGGSAGEIPALSSVRVKESQRDGP